MSVATRRREPGVPARALNHAAACTLRLRPLPYRPDPALTLLPPPCARSAPNRRLSAWYSPAGGAQHRDGIGRKMLCRPGKF